MPVHGLIRLARPLNAFLSAVGVWVGSLLAGAPLAPSPFVLAGALAAFAFASAGNVRNDLSDVAVDRTAHPDRPLVTGEVAPRAARFLALALYVLALAAASAVSLAALVLTALALPIMESYERILKQRGLPGNAAIALLSAAPFVMGALAAPVAESPAWGASSFAAIAAPAALAVALLAALATLGREILKDIEDEPADRGARVTLPMRIGATRAALVAAACLVAATLLSPLPWLLQSVLAWPSLPAIGLADACFLAAAFVGARSPSRGQRLVKAGMVLAMIALVAGVALGGLAA